MYSLMRFPEDTFTHKAKRQRDFKMKKCVVNAGKFYFLNFTFNPKSRTLQQYDTVLQLRKKQSDVLALLCAKYPEPVSQAEFLAEVWGGGYVTSQSIAQMICSLRVSLGDDTKSIIVTIPKLGYQLTAEPRWEELETEPGMPGYDSSFSGDIGMDNVYFSTQSMINVNPVRVNSMSIIPYSAARPVPGRRKFTPQTLFFSTIAAIFFSIIFFCMAARSNSLDFIKNHNDIDQMPLANLLQPIGSNFFYCCHTAEEAICHPQVNRTGFSGD